MRDLGCTTTACWLPPGHQYEAALRDLGFVVGSSALFSFADESTMLAPPAAARLIDDPACRFHVTLGDFDFGRDAGAGGTLAGVRGRT